VPIGEPLGDWPDERVWEELQLRLATEGWRVNEGHVFDKGITPMRSFVCAPMQGYSQTALRRVWRAQHFSNDTTQLLRDFGQGPFDRRLQLARREHLSRSRAAAVSLAENYAGLPAQPDF
jgi:p-hydroxybenzoate 3-monooxygenase